MNNLPTEKNCFVMAQILICTDLKYFLKLYVNQISENFLRGNKQISPHLELIVQLLRNIHNFYEGMEDVNEKQEIDKGFKLRKLSTS